MTSTAELKTQATELALESIQELNANGEENYDFVNGQIVKEVYIGTTFNIMPSGKFYTPWAKSNIDPCPLCKGTGEVVNLNGLGSIYDHAWEIEKDLIWVMNLKKSRYDEMPVEWRTQIDAARYIQKVNEPDSVCPKCHGHGSREVYEDTVFQETLEKVLEMHDCYLTNSEGCASDIVVGKVVREMTDDEIKNLSIV